MRISSTVVPFLSLLAVAACGVGEITGPGPGGGGGGGGGGGEGPDARVAPGTPDAPQTFAVAVTGGETSTTLGTEVHYTVTLTSSNFGGTIALTPTGAPASWTATVEPAQLQLALDGTATADLKVVIPSDTPDLTGTVGISAYGTPGTQVASAPALTVANEYVVTIANGIGNTDHKLPPRVELRLGAKLRIMDADGSANHQVHSDSGGSGFPHQGNAMSVGQEYDVTPTETGSFKWYCHIHGQGLDGNNSNLVIK